MEVINVAGLKIFIDKSPVARGTTWQSTTPPGIWLGTLLEGHLAVDQSLLGAGEWRQGASTVFSSDDEMQTEHRALKDGSVSAVFLQIEAPQAAAVLGEEAAEMLSEVARRDGTVFPQVARAIAWQMAGCGLTGPSRDLYMTGKALEMIAHVLQDIGPTAPRAETGSSRWSSRDVECFHAARGVLLANLAAPPSVTDLARQVGTNARKLSQGFADLFGMPVYRFVKASRFEAAKLMLEGGETSVSRVARQFGYQPQHFATEFRRRFGISPGQITGKRA